MDCFALFAMTDLVLLQKITKVIASKAKQSINKFIQETITKNSSPFLS